MCVLAYIWPSFEFGSVYLPFVSLFVFYSTLNVYYLKESVLHLGDSGGFSPA